MEPSANDMSVDVDEQQHQKIILPTSTSTFRRDDDDRMSGYWTPRQTIKRRATARQSAESSKSVDKKRRKRRGKIEPVQNKEQPPKYEKWSPLESNRAAATSLSSLNDASKVQFTLSQTPPMAPSHNFSPILQTFNREHRGELDMSEKYNYDLSKAQLKASSRTSALLAGFAMVALVELEYDAETPRPLLILLGVVTSLLVSVLLLALMMSTCILPYMEATGCTQDSPYLRLKFYIDLSWIFSTCIGLFLFLVEIGIIFFVKFDAIHYRTAGYITTAMLVSVIIAFIVFSYLIHKNRVSHSLGRFKHKVNTMKQFLDVEAQLPKAATSPTIKDI